MSEGVSTRRRFLRRFLLGATAISTLSIVGRVGPAESQEDPSADKKAFMRAVLEPPEPEPGAPARPPVGIPAVAPFADWDYYYMIQPIAWEPGDKHKARFKRVEVPQGFVTDLASIPRIFWRELPRTGRYAHAAIVHDFLYWTQTVARAVADEIFDIDMIETGTPGWKASAIAGAVRTFGSGAWEENARLKAKGEKRFLKKFPTDPTVTWADWKKQKDIWSD